MSEKLPGKSDRARALRIIALAAIGLAVIWAVHPPVLEWALKTALRKYCSSLGLKLEAATIRVRLGTLIQVENLVISGASGSRLAASRLDVSLANPTAWFAKSARLIERAGVSGLDGYLHTDDLAPRSHDELPSAPDIRWIPANIDLERISLEVANRDSRFAVRNLAGKFRERSTARMTASEIIVQIGALSWTHEAVRAATAWKNGTLWLGEMQVHRDVSIEEVAADFLHVGGPKISLAARIFGGSLRGDLTLGNQIDAAFWASNIPLNPLPELTGLSERVTGRLVEGRLTYRGDTSRPADAEASLRLFADAFRWNDRGWESLEIGASLIHQRLVVTDFDLRQKENRVNVNGEISIAEGWSQIAKSPFLINVSADLKELGALGDLIGGPFNEVSGRMSATGSVSGRSGQLDGFLSIESSGIEFRSLPVKSLKVETVFRRNEVEIAKAEIYSRKDFVEARGVLGLSSPHVYAGELKARIDDVAKYLGPFRAPGADLVYSGALDATWQGDGTWKAPSGAFDIHLTRFVSDATPAGLTGKFSGTYSPQNVYFSEFGIENGPLHLDSRATFASSGVTLADLEVRSGSALLAEGAGFLPLDVFALFAGKDWRSSISLDSEAYVRLITLKDVQVANLLQMLGQRDSLQGILNLNLEARGLAGKLESSGSFSLNKIRFSREPKFPESALQLKFRSAGGEANIEGSLASQGLSPITVRTRMPFGLAADDSGALRWINPSGLFEAEANFPKSDLLILSPLLPDLRRFAGRLSGNMAVTGTVADPQATGRADVRDAVFEVSANQPPWKDVNASVVFEKSEARMESFQGTIGGSPVAIAGKLAFPGPTLDLRVEGKKVPIPTGSDVPLRANVDLQIKAQPGSGSISGGIRLVDGRVPRRLEVTPLKAPPPETRSLAPPTRPALGQGLGIFRGWKLGIHVSNETPFLWTGNPSDGQIFPEITLSGTIAKPVPVGRIGLRQIRAVLPSTNLTIADGRIDFFPDAPWVPFLDIRGTAEVSGYTINACAFGPAGENKLILRSEPTLSLDAIIDLLTTGDPIDDLAFRLDSAPAPRDSGGLWELGEGLGGRERSGNGLLGPSYVWRLK